MEYLFYALGLVVLAGVTRVWLYNTLQGRRVLRYLGIRTKIRGDAHSGKAASGGSGASLADKRNG